MLYILPKNGNKVYGRYPQIPLKKTGEMTEVNYMGRRPKEIDQKQFENLCGLQCTYEAKKQRRLLGIKEIEKARKIYEFFEFSELRG
jgi:hypothetical protein|nr:MAG TPA: hypothetical protein [Caudoviricetes sp.]